MFKQYLSTFGNYTTGKHASKETQKSLPQHVIVIWFELSPDYRSFLQIQTDRYTANQQIGIFDTCFSFIFAYNIIKLFPYAGNCPIHSSDICIHLLFQYYRKDFSHVPQQL